MKFSDIPQLTHWGGYSIDVFWNSLESQLNGYIGQGLQLSPDFQRAHVWTAEQQRAYVEFILRGGRSGKDILLNSPSWHSDSDVVDGYDDFVLVDGKQRLEAVMAFLRNDLYISFNSKHCFFEDFEDRMRYYLGFRFHINCLRTRREVLQWYLDINTGGTPHTSDEIERVRVLLDKEPRVSENQH
jgi:hypothetical protein